MSLTADEISVRDYFGDEQHKERVYSSLIASLGSRAENLGIKL
jgi:hypothetical protein